MKKILYVLSALMIAGAITFSSCDEVDRIVDGLTDSLSTEEVVAGLKTALEVGTDSSTTELSEDDGYYGDALVKIPLPDEAEVVRQQVVAIVNKVPELSNYFSLDNEFENVVKSINKAAEEAASEAKPIFVDAITDMSIADGWDILNGINPEETTKAGVFDSTAATGYFKSKTQLALKALFAPKIDVQLNKKLIGNFSANEAWTTLRTSVNNVLDSEAYKIASLGTSLKVNRIEEESIGNFATEKALDGLFFKVGEQEKKIRANPFDWALDIIRKVFGWDATQGAT